MTLTVTPKAIVEWRSWELIECETDVLKITNRERIPMEQKNSVASLLR